MFRNNVCIKLSMTCPPKLHILNLVLIDLQIYVNNRINVENTIYIFNTANEHELILYRYTQNTYLSIYNPVQFSAQTKNQPYSKSRKWFVRWHYQLWGCDSIMYEVGTLVGTDSLFQSLNWISEITVVSRDKYRHMLHWIHSVWKKQASFENYLLGLRCGYPSLQLY